MQLALELPGFKETTTSKEAAKEIASSAIHLRYYALATLRKHGPMTADECAEKMIPARHPFSIRPRFTELFKSGRIVWTGERRKNSSGMSAKVWRALPLPGEAARIAALAEKGST